MTFLKRLALIWLAAADLAAGCASDYGEKDAQRTDCSALQNACNAQCEAAFEEDPNAWDYQSCIQSCRPSDRSQCR